MVWETRPEWEVRKWESERVNNNERREYIPHIVKYWDRMRECKKRRKRVERKYGLWSESFARSINRLNGVALANVRLTVSEILLLRRSCFITLLIFHYFTVRKWMSWIYSKPIENHETNQKLLEISLLKFPSSCCISNIFQQVMCSGMKQVHEEE